MRSPTVGDKKEKNWNNGMMQGLDNRDNIYSNIENLVLWARILCFSPIVPKFHHSMVAA